MQRAFTVGISAKRAECGGCKGVSRSLAQRGGYSALFRPGERLVQSRLATISGVAMNDPILGRSVDSRNRRVNLIGGALWR